jgi:hypothetical protein
MSIARPQDDQPATEWESPFTLEAARIEAFEREGFAKLKGVFSADSLGVLRREVMKTVQRDGSSVAEQNEDEAYPSEDMDLYRKAFTQVYNLWSQSELIRSFVSGRLAQIAAGLLGVSGVRGYHHQPPADVPREQVAILLSCRTGLLYVSQYLP